MDSFYYLAMDTGIVKLHEFNRANDGMDPRQQPSTMAFKFQ